VPAVLEGESETQVKRVASDEEEGVGGWKVLRRAGKPCTWSSDWGDLHHYPQPQPNPLVAKGYPV